MTEWKLFEGNVPYVSTAAFHADRERAPHLEQEFHKERLHLAADMVREAVQNIGDGATVADFGCGDGGLLSLVQKLPGVGAAWGYDFCPANEAGWAERGVRAYSRDVFGADWPKISMGEVVVMTEVLEHLADPHGALYRLRAEDGPNWLVCSSPWNEHPGSHSPEHAWAWDLPGYAQLITDAGWEIIRHEQAGLFQVVLAR
jgi:hypothetical protein